MEKKLRVKMSDFKTSLTFNEWTEKYNVGRDYVTPTPYFKGNPTTGYDTLFDQKKTPFLEKIRNAVAEFFCV